MKRAAKETNLTQETLLALVRRIVKEAQALKDKHTTGQKDAPVNYACIFSKDQDEYAALIEVVSTMGPQVDSTQMGPIFDIGGIETSAGRLRVLKVRLPDQKRPERGDADFTVSNYPEFKRTYLTQPGFGLLTRPNFEMIELADPDFDALAYFSYPPLDEQLGLK